MKKTTTLFKMMLGLGMVLGFSANAQIIMVTNTNDSGAGSLRQAVIDAEAGSTITFDADIDGNTIMLENEIEIDKNLTIQGNGDDNTMISGSDETRIFVINDADVTINNLTLTDGSAEDSGGAIWASGSVLLINNTTISGNEAHGDSSTQGGGGIYIEDGELTLNASVVSDNEASGDSGSGGGILIGTDGEVTVNDGEISGNFASRAGGGIEINSGNDSLSLTLTDVTVDANTTGSNPGNGGGLHITGMGDAMISGGVFSNNEAESEGGGLWNGDGMLTIDGTVISDNWAHGDGADQGGGGVYNLSGMVHIMGEAMISGNHADGTSGSGGGILNDMGGELDLENIEISTNVSSRAGGGIEDNGGSAGSVTMVNVTLDGNSAGMNPGNGGGLHVTGNGNVNITGGTVTNNNASQGGGLWNSTGIMTVANVEIDGNSATGLGTNDGGGGIYNNGGTLNLSASTVSNNEAEGLFGRGGGLHLNGGTATMVKTTLSGNSAFTNGGGIFNNGQLMLNANTIANNSALVNGGGIMNGGSNMLSIKNSIVAENTALLGGDLFGEDEDIESEGYNLIGNLDADIFASLESDIMGTLENPLDFGLLELSDNGGSTRTHRLACPSPAADAGDPEDSSTDQLDQSVFNGRRDIGAYEEQEVCATADVDDFDSATASMVYPNPSLNGLVNLELSANHSIGATVSIYEIASGKLVKEMTADDMNIQIGVGNLATGTYVMQIVSDRATETHKFIVGK